MTDLTTLSSERFKNFIDSFDTVITDCDGVLYLRYQLLPGALDTIQNLTSLNKIVRYLSNNSTSGEELLRKKLNDIGFKANLNDLVIPELAINHYLKSINFKKKVYLIGTKMLAQNMKKAGLQIVRDEIFEINETAADVAKIFEPDYDIGAVVIENDFNLSYFKLLRATVHLKRPEVLFLVGATDVKTPIGQGAHILGAGYFYKMIEDFCNRKATIFGKPSSELVKYTLDKFEIKDPKRILFIGDSLKQDMSFASEAGFQKLLVLTGLSNLEDLNNCENVCEIPDFYIQSLKEFDQLLSNQF